MALHLWIKLRRTEFTGQPEHEIRLQSLAPLIESQLLVSHLIMLYTFHLKLKHLEIGWPDKIPEVKVLRTQLQVASNQQQYLCCSTYFAMDLC